MSGCHRQASAGAGKGKDVSIAKFVEKASHKPLKIKKKKRGGKGGEGEANGKQGDNANEAQGNDELPVSTFLRSGLEAQCQLQNPANCFELHNTWQACSHAAMMANVQHSCGSCLPSLPGVW